MAGGLLQLLVYGSADLFLTNQPQITYFKTVYRRYTNFSIQTFEEKFFDEPNFGKTGRIKLDRIGDLVSRMYIKVIIARIDNCGGKFAWVRRLGHAMIEKVEIEIGGIVIDKHYGIWLDIWYELVDKGNSYLKTIGDFPELIDYNSKSKPQATLYIPLQFWFNRHIGLALPLIAIQYHDIYINVSFQDKMKLIVRDDKFCDFSSVKILEVDLVSDFIFLDIEERKRFAQVNHEYLIEQVQNSGEICIVKDYTSTLLNFNYPTKELIWVIKNDLWNCGEKFLCYNGLGEWEKEIEILSKNILYDSIIFNDVCDMNNGKWEKIYPKTKSVVSHGNIKIKNYSTKCLWLNTASLVLKQTNANLIEKIKATIYVNDNSIRIKKIRTKISVKDISIPVRLYYDTRIRNSDVCIYQFNNYGMKINGKGNPLKQGMLKYNGDVRVENRNGKFFGVLQPYLHHSCTPVDGINLYSFALTPELLQPSGTSNLTVIEQAILQLWTKRLSGNLFIYGFSYNIYRIISGCTGLMYYM